jgi:hypothetical protein
MPVSPSLRLLATSVGIRRVGDRTLDPVGGLAQDPLVGGLDDHLKVGVADGHVAGRDGDVPGVLDPRDRLAQVLLDNGLVRVLVRHYGEGGGVRARRPAATGRSKGCRTVGPDGDLVGLDAVDVLDGGLDPLGRLVGGREARAGG